MELNCIEHDVPSWDIARSYILQDLAARGLLTSSIGEQLEVYVT